jgi:hypothetical protein
MHLKKGKKKFYQNIFKKIKMSLLKTKNRLIYHKYTIYLILLISNRCNQIIEILIIKIILYKFIQQIKKYHCKINYFNYIMSCCKDKNFKI